MKPTDLDDLAATLYLLGRGGFEMAPHPTDAGRLRLRPTRIPPGLSARLAAHRGAILGLLKDGCTSDPRGDGSDAEYVLGERLGIADALGLATHPGSAAWLVAVGESMGIVALSEPTG